MRCVHCERFLKKQHAPFVYPRSLKVAHLSCISQVNWPAMDQYLLAHPLAAIRTRPERAERGERGDRMERPARDRQDRTDWRGGRV